MIDHFYLPVSDVSRSRDFYRQVLGALGMAEDMVFRGASVFGLGGPGAFWIHPKAKDPSPEGGPCRTDIDPAAPFPRLHIAFRAPSRAHVERFAELAEMFGGVVVHSPRVLPEYHDSYFAAFVRDPDGHNIEAVCSEPS
jgi:catechol 2,3-dioxygenase-like lactoylglutathione lyase family enzyme